MKLIILFAVSLFLATGVFAQNGSVTATPKPFRTPTKFDINPKPLADFAYDLVKEWGAKKIDLSRNFVVVLNGVLTPDGKLDRDKSKFDVTKQTGDKKMIKVAKAAILAVGDSNYLSYLRSLNVDKVTLSLSQDDARVTGTIAGAQTTAERAKVIATGLNMTITVGKIKLTDPNSDERILLDGAKVTADGKRFVCTFILPKPVAQEMLTRKVKKALGNKAHQP